MRSAPQLQRLEHPEDRDDQDPRCHRDALGHNHIGVGLGKRHDAHYAEVIRIALVSSVPKFPAMTDPVRNSIPPAKEVIDDLRFEPPLAVTGTGWALISDRVMGGVSDGAMTRETVAGRAAVRMTGGVSLQNNGGFLQVALDLGDAGGVVDASRWVGVRLDVFGNDHVYNLHLRTADILRPWESFRQSFEAPGRWTTVFLPFVEFAPHRSDRPFNPSRLRRLGIVAIGREFEADIAISDIRFYAEPAGPTVP